MQRSAGPEDRFPPSNAEDDVRDMAGANGSRFRDQPRDPVSDPSRILSRDQSPDQSSDQTGTSTSRVLGERDLDSALQLLVERAQYITGATGTALALAQGEEMVCRASAGSSAPAVGARVAGSFRIDRGKHFPTPVAALRQRGDRPARESGSLPGAGHRVHSRLAATATERRGSRFV